MRRQMSVELLSYPRLRNVGVQLLIIVVASEYKVFVDPCGQVTSQLDESLPPPVDLL